MSIPPTKQQPPASPSHLNPKRVSRLNYWPLVVVGIIVFLFACGVCYTAWRRTQPVTQARADGDTSAHEGATPPSFLGTAQTTQASPIPKPAPSPNAKDPAPHQEAPTTPSTMPDPRIAAWQAFWQQQQQLEQKRLEEADNALHASADTSGNGSARGQGGGRDAASLDVPGMAAGLPPGTTMASAGALSGGFSANAISSGGSPSGAGGGTDPVNQASKRAFLGQTGDPLGMNEDLAGFVHGPKQSTIMAGTAIRGVMVGGGNSDMPGMIIGQVSHTVCDSMTGSIPLIPQGTRVIGTYDNSVSQGQTRMGVVWTRAIFPDSASRQLGAMEGADQSGSAGLHDIVRTHFWEKFLSQTLISFGGAAAQLAQPQQSAFSGYSPSSVAAGSLTQGYSQLGQEYARAGLSIPNTLEIRPGYEFTIMVNKDLTLPQYIDHRTGRSVDDCGSRAGEAQQVNFGPVMQ